MRKFLCDICYLWYVLCPISILPDMAHLSANYMFQGVITTSSAPLALNNLADHLEYFNIQFNRQRVQYGYRESVSTRAVLRVLNKKNILHVQAICHTEFCIIHNNTGQNVTCHTGTYYSMLMLKCTFLESC